MNWKVDFRQVFIDGSVLRRSSNLNVTDSPEHSLADLDPPQSTMSQYTSLLKDPGCTQSSLEREEGLLWM